MEDIIRRCRETGITCVNICDHDSVEGAFKLRELAPFKVIVSEEILTDRGEIMGMFLNERVPSHITLEDAISRIRAQGGLVGVPHPCDNLARFGLGATVMREIISEIDMIEVFNSRSPRAECSDTSLAFSKEHNLAASAGSDAHTIGEIGNAWVEMPDFNTSEEFLAALRAGRIRGRRANYLVHLASTWAKLRHRRRETK